MSTTLRTETIYSADSLEFAEELVGRRITQLRDDTLILDDGTILVIKGGGGCCAWFTGEFRKIDFNDNIITRVTSTEATGNDDAPEVWSIVIYSADAQIAAVDIMGDSGTGYYGNSINLEVKRVE